MAAKCAVYRDITKRMLDEHIIGQAMFDLLEIEIQRLEQMPIHSNEAESVSLARNVTIIEPTVQESSQQNKS